MARPGFAGRRARSRVGQLAAFGGVVLLATAALAGLGGAAARAIDDGSRELFADASPTAAALRVQTRLDGPDAAAAAAQDRTVRGLISSAFRGAPVTVIRSLSSDTADTSIGGVATPMLLLADPTLADPTLAHRVTVTDGSWPSSPGQVAVQATAANALGLAVGDELIVEGEPLTVAALWRAVDVSDPAWFGDPAQAAGAVEGLPGPVVADVSVLERLEDAPVVDWTVVPQRATLIPARLGGYGDGVTLLTASLGDYAQGRSSSVDLQGTLGATVARVARATGTATGVLGIPLVLIAVLGGIVLALIARSLVVGRRGEFVLLLARGASRPDLVAATAGEVALVSVLGGILGAAAASGLLLLLGGGAMSTGSMLTLLLTSGGCVLAAVALATVVTIVEVRAPVTGRSEGGSASAVAALGPFAAAARALWSCVAGALGGAVTVAQYLVVGSPVRSESDGRVHVDLVALAAPIALLVALALAAPVIAGPLFALAERASRGARGILPVLSLRQLARRTRSVAAAVLVVAVTAGAVVLALRFEQQTDEVDAARTSAATGADLRVSVDEGGSVDAQHAGVSSAAVRDLPGVGAVTAVIGDPVSIGRDAIPVVAGDPTALSRLPGGGSLARPTPALTAARARDAPLAGATTLSLATTVRAGAGVPADAVVTVLAWLADGDGGAVRVPLGTLAAGASASVALTAPLPAARALIALEFVPPPLPDGAMIDVRVDSVDAGGPVGGLASQTANLGDHGEAVRLLPSGTPAGRIDPIPVALTSQLAARLDARVGAKLVLYAGSVSAPITAKVAAIVPRLPGLAPGLGLFVDLETLVAAAVDLGGSVPATDQLWVTTGHPDAVADMIRARIDQRVEIVTARTVSTAPVVRPAVQLFWIGTAVAAVLSALGFAAVMAAIARERAGERVPLRSLGMRPAQQRRARLFEGAAVALLALVLGLAAGLVTAALLVPGLAEVGS